MSPYVTKLISEPRGCVWTVFPAQGPRVTRVWPFPSPGSVDWNGFEATCQCKCLYQIISINRSLLQLLPVTPCLAIVRLQYKAL
jgi:hypothetical protein